MTDTAPEQIWVDGDTIFNGPHPLAESTPYTRTDIHDAVVAERDRLRGALGEIAILPSYPNSKNGEPHSTDLIARDALKETE